MSHDEGFANWIARIRTGDDGATVVLVAQYEPERRRSIEPFVHLGLEIVDD